jgi:hypothetical protein
MAHTATKRDPIRKVLRLEALRQKQDAIKAKIAKLEAKRKLAVHKEDIRLKLLLGSAILTTANLHPETRPGIVAALQNTVTAQRDVDFLKDKNWL